MQALALHHYSVLSQGVRRHHRTSNVSSRQPIRVHASKGFGNVKPTSAKDGCPCGSGKFYKECCKPYITGASVAGDLNAAIRARFTSILKKEVDYLERTYHPEFLAFHYTKLEPAEAAERLRRDLQVTCDEFEYSDLKIIKVEPGDRPNEMYAEFRYAVLDKKAPALDKGGQPRRTVRVEKSRFLQEGGVWQFVDYQLAEVPEALMRAKEKELSESLQGTAQLSEGLQAAPQ